MSLNTSSHHLSLREKIGYAEDSAEPEFFMRFLFGDFGDLFKKKE